MENDTLIYFGDAVKALDDNGKVGGLLLRFTTAKRKDLDGQYFDKEGYYGPNNGDGSECLFDHGYAVPAEKYIKDLKESDARALQAFADHTFPPIKTTRTPLGIFAETVLNLEDEYEKFIYSRVKAGKIGWSSGAPGHRVKIEKDGRIVRWPIAEGSLTPRPAEPLNRVATMKSLASVKFVDLMDDEGADDGKPSCNVCHENFVKGLQDYQCREHRPLSHNALAVVLAKHIDDRIDNGHTRDSIIKALARESGLQLETIDLILSDSFRATDPNLKAFARVLGISFDMLKSATRRDYARTIKGMFEEALADQTPSRWQLDSIYCDLTRKIAVTAQASAVTGVEFDAEAKIKEATAEYLSRLQSLAISQINDYVESGSDEPFYLKAIIDLKSDLPVSEGLDLEDHSQLAVSVLRDVIKRFRANHEARQREGNNQKAGRVLSAANRTRLGNMLEQIQSAVSDCQKLLEESQPMATEEKMRAAKTRHLALRTERRQAIGA